MARDQPGSSRTAVVIIATQARSTALGMLPCCRAASRRRGVAGITRTEASAIGSPEVEALFQRCLNQAAESAGPGVGAEIHGTQEHERGKGLKQSGAGSERHRP